jgi:hypothetical protein
MRHLALFFVLGAVLFFVKRGVEATMAERPQLVVSVPSSASAADVERAIEQALLTDLALSGPSLRSDPVVREQLVQAMGGARANQGEATLVERALSLGVHRVDPVVRERLAFQGEQMLRSRVAVAEPSDAQLLLYMREHDARYRQPARASFMHVFLSRARRGAALASDAAELLARLTRENARHAVRSHHLAARARAGIRARDRRAPRARRGRAGARKSASDLVWSAELVLWLTLGAGARALACKAARAERREGARAWRLPARRKA